MVEIQLQYDRKDYRFTDAWISVFQPMQQSVDELKATIKYLSEHFPKLYRNFRIVEVKEIFYVD
jgi:hypothetical protein